MCQRVKHQRVASIPELENSQLTSFYGDSWDMIQHIGVTRGHTSEVAALDLDRSLDLDALMTEDISVDFVYCSAHCDSPLKNRFKILSIQCQKCNIGRRQDNHKSCDVRRYKKQETATTTDVDLLASMPDCQIVPTISSHNILHIISSPVSAQCPQFTPQPPALCTCTHQLCVRECLSGSAC